MMIPRGVEAHWVRVGTVHQPFLIKEIKAIRKKQNKSKTHQFFGGSEKPYGMRSRFGPQLSVMQDHSAANQRPVET